MDLGASILLDTLFMRAERRRANRGESKLEIQGYGSRLNRDVNIMLFASGLPTRLGISIELPPEIRDRVSTFDRQSGSASHLEKDKHRNQCASDLTVYFDGCLRKKGYSLSAIGKANLGILITEVIGNAQEHAGPWHAVGFYDDLKLGSISGECHIVIFNEGPSIYETLLAPDVSPSLQHDLKNLSDHHESQGWLTRKLLRRGALTEECLWTLYALQDRVTRFYGRPGGEDRGAGTVKMIEFFEQLAGDAPMRMCVLSGGAYILFDGKHKIRPVRVGSEELKVIAFNDDNDIWKAPDPYYVRQLNRRFPGTVISIRLTLDRNVLERLSQGITNAS